MDWLLYSHPGIRAGGHVQNSPPRTRFLRVHRNSFYGGLDPPGMVGHTVKLRRILRPPQHINSHMIAGRAYAIFTRTQSIGRGHACPLPGEMAIGFCPHRQRQGSRDISLPRPDPIDPSHCHP